MIVPLGDEIAVALDLEALVGSGIRERRFDVAGDDPQALRIEARLEVLAQPVEEFGHRLDDGLGARITSPPMRDDPAAAEQFAAWCAGELESNFFPLMTLLNGYETLQGAVELVIVGDPAAPATEALRRAVYGRSLPDKNVRRLAPGAGTSGHQQAPARQRAHERNRGIGLVRSGVGGQTNAIAPAGRSGGDSHRKQDSPWQPCHQPVAGGVGSEAPPPRRD